MGTSMLFAEPAPAPKRRAQLAARLAPKTSAGIKKRLKKMTRKKAMVKGLERL